MSLPDREAILAFIRQAPNTVGKREIARAFGLRGAAREGLKDLLAEMETEGLLAGGPGRTLHEAGRLPRVTMLRVVSADGGRVLATPERWEGEGAPPKVLVAATGRDGRKQRLLPGDRLLARIGEAAAGILRATLIRRLPRTATDILGVVGKDEHGHLLIQSVDRRERRRFPLHHQDHALPGELVRATLKGSGARAVARLTSSLGDPFAAVSLSDIAIAAKNIPCEFPEQATEDAGRAATSPLGEREDWTAIPFLTIDPSDARDHDDAVHAEAEGDGFRLLVAIADVSWFVRPGSVLDREAFTRGNSIYFPDRVVPMLPEALSADACSLKKGTAKAVLAASILVGADGKLRHWRFHRAKIRVAENLAYEEAQARIDRGEDPRLASLWACWRALDAARTARQPLEIDLPERRVLLDGKGDVAGVATRQRLDAHKVIEEMMIAANVAAAKALEEKKAPVMYRCHETPDREKLSALKEYLGTLGISFALGQVIAPAIFNRVLERARDRADFTEISEAVLRAQTQACYTPQNSGHFGLSLASYAHFTSPIRRYSDILVHRSLVRALQLGDGGLLDGAGPRFSSIGEHLSFTERRAMEAERETLDRYIARYLSASVGQQVRARITGVQAFGFFASVVDLGGDGLVPVSSLGEERFRFDEKGRYLEGVESGTRYRQGQLLDLCLAEADMVTGALRFSIPGVEPMQAQGRKPGQRPRRDDRPILRRRR